MIFLLHFASFALILGANSFSYGLCTSKRVQSTPPRSIELMHFVFLLCSATLLHRFFSLFLCSSFALPLASAEPMLMRFSKAEMPSPFGFGGADAEKRRHRLRRSRSEEAVRLWRKAKALAPLQRSEASASPKQRLRRSKAEASPKQSRGFAEAKQRLRRSEKAKKK
uniref:Transmembrane protein n=1 Tax=Hydrodictyon reticulatum TaxID=3107 RepID=A0A1W5RMZ9_HYDRE|nr:hypothetical protein [Hydrodictyon reticulatum]AQU64558.1 hypothetical protein [Hydrodictyon reticulatum]